MTPAIVYSFSYCQFEDEKSVGMNGSYINDFLQAGMDDWKTHSDATPERFKHIGNQQTQFTYARIHITEAY